jgi:hypothetical protein
MGTWVIDLDDYKAMKAACASREKYAREGRDAFVTLEENEKRRASKAV